MRLGVIVISPDALIIRTVRADAWTAVCWRGIFTLAGSLVMLAMLRSGRTDSQRAGSRPFRPVLFAGALFAAAAPHSSPRCIGRTPRACW